MKRFALALGALLLTAGIVQALDVQRYSSTAANNNIAAPDGWPENMAPSGVNDSARENMAASKRLLEDFEGARSTTTASPSDGAYFFTTFRTISAAYTGMRLSFTASTTATGPVTLNVNSFGAATIFKLHDQELASGDIEQNQIITVVYDGSSFQLVSQLANAGGLIAPASSTDNCVVLWDGTGGDTVKNCSGTGTTGHPLLSQGSSSNPVFQQVSTAGIADADDGTLLTWSASRTATTVTPGTTGQVLTSRGDASTPTFQTIGGGYTSISFTAITAGTNFDITGFASATYDNYEIWISNGQPGNDGVILRMLTSTDGGTSFDTGTSDYSWAVTADQETAAVDQAGDADDGEIQLSGTLTVGNAANENISLRISIYSPEATEFTTFTWEGTSRGTTGIFRSLNGAGDRQSAADVNAIRLHWNTGDWIAQGNIQFLGIAQ